MLAVCRLVACCLIPLAATVPAAAEITRVPYPGDHLAYISGGKLYVGSGQVPGPGSAFQPVFSHDGRWLAFLRQRWRGNSLSSQQVWLARADGSSPRRISSIRAVAGFRWSPSADVLAVQSGAGSTRLVSVDGRVHSLPHGLRGSVLWSADGRTMAIFPNRLGTASFSVVSDHSVRSYSLPGVGSRDGVAVVGWWPDARGILYWIDPGGCNSCVADGVPILAYDIGTRKVRSLGVAVAYSDWIAPLGNRLLAVKGGDRSAFFGKHLQLCVADGRCKTLPGGSANQISIDPAWAPGGGQMAFVVAPAWRTWGFRSPARYSHWLDAHVLWTAQPDGSGARPAGAEVPKGVQDPQWTRDGRGILFVKGGALWLDPHLGAANPHLIARLVPAGSVPSPRIPVYQGWYYGHMNWRDLYAWY